MRYGVVLWVFLVYVHGPYGRMIVAHILLIVVVSFPGTMGTSWYIHCVVWFDLACVGTCVRHQFKMR